MREIFTTSRFDKRLTAFVRRHPELYTHTRSLMEMIAKDPYASTLHTHRLNGDLADCFASRLSRDYRIVFVLARDRVTFVNIGTHDDVYR
jgi:mRNA-degrading endonuclease YafQ of YafQ-DinJ toxin-antitoxin module